MKLRIPPEIGWPLFVIALLLGSLGTGAAIVYYAGSDGGVQVVHDTLPQASTPETGDRQSP